MKTSNYSATALLLISVIALAGCSSQHEPAARIPQVSPNVALTSAKRATVPSYFEATGTVRATQTSTVASQMMGNIVAMRVHEGDHVVRGEVLAVIDDSVPRAGVDRAVAAQSAAQQEVTAANTDFQLAQTTLKRYQDLYSKKSVSPQEFDEIQARFDGAKARLDMGRAGLAQAEAAVAQAHTALSYSQVRAPFDGLITQKLADPGTLATPGMPLFTVEDPRHYRLEASVDEGDIVLVRRGQSIPVGIDALGGTLQGKVAEIVPAADPATRSFLVKIDLPSEAHLHAGLFGRAKFERGERTAIFVARSAVVDRGQLQGVYVVDGTRNVSLRYITLGPVSGDQVEVLSGLDGSEQLVANPGNQDFSGQQIEAQR